MAQMNDDNNQNDNNQNDDKSLNTLNQLIKKDKLSQQDKLWIMETFNKFKKEKDQIQMDYHLIVHLSKKNNSRSDGLKLLPEHERDFRDLTDSSYLCSVDKVTFEFEVILRKIQELLRKLRLVPARNSSKIKYVGAVNVMDRNGLFEYSFTKCNSCIKTEAGIDSICWSLKCSNAVLNRFKQLNEIRNKLAHWNPDAANWNPGAISEHFQYVSQKLNKIYMDNYHWMD